MGEWKRLINVRYLLIVGVAVLVNILLFGYEQFRGKSYTEFSQEQEQRQYVMEYYAQLPVKEAINQITAVNKSINSELREQRPDSEQDVKDEINEEIIGNLDSQEESVVIDETKLAAVMEYYHGLSDGNRTIFQRALNDVKANLEYIAHYNENVSAVIENAEKLGRFSVFSNENSYSNRNIQQTAKDYRRVENLQVNIGNNQAVEHFLEYPYLFYMGLALMVLLVYNIFKERENGMWAMVHGAEKGRAKLAFSRMRVILGAAFFVLFWLYGSVLVESFLLYGGVNSLFAPVQNLQQFSGFTYILSQGEYLIVLFMASWLALFSFSSLFWMLFVVFRNRNHALVVAGIFTGLEVLLYQKIPVQSVYGVFKKVNIVRILQMNEILSVYENWRIGSAAVSVWKIIMVVLLSILLISLLFALSGTVRMRPQGKISIVTVLMHRVNEWYQHLFMRMPILVKEFHKLVITSRGTWVLVVVVLLAVYFAGTGAMHFTSAMKEKDQIYLEHGGEEYTYVEDLVKTRQEEYREVCAKAEELFQNYQEESGSLQELVSISNQVTQYATRLKSVEEFKDKLEYLERIETDYGVDGYLISDRGYEEIFGQYSVLRELILLLIYVTGVMLIVSECVIMEYRTGMEYILRSSKHGRERLVLRKIISCVLLTVMVFIIVYGIDFIMLAQLYGFPYLQAPLMSLTFMEGVSVTYTIMDWIILRLLIRVLIGIGAMLAAFITSRIIGKSGNRGLSLLVIVIVLSVLLIVHKYYPMLV